MALGDELAGPGDAHAYSQSRKSFPAISSSIGLLPERPLQLRDPPPLLSGQRPVLAGLEALHARLDHLIAPPPQQRL